MYIVQPTTTVGSIYKPVVRCCAFRPRDETLSWSCRCTPTFCCSSRLLCVPDVFLPTAGTWSASRRPRRRSFPPHGWNLERLQTTASSIVRLPPHGVNRCRPSLLPMLPSHMLTARHNRPYSRCGPCSPPVQPMFACCTDV